MGKSALLEVLRGAVVAAGGADRSATCRDGVAGPPFWPVLQMVRAAANRLDRPGRTRLARALGPLREAVPALADLPDTGRRAARWGGPRDGADARLRRARRRPGLGTGGRCRPARPGGVRRPARSRPGHPPAGRPAWPPACTAHAPCWPSRCAAGRAPTPRRSSTPSRRWAGCPGCCGWTSDPSRHRPSPSWCRRRPPASSRRSGTGSQPARRATRSSRWSWREGRRHVPGGAVPPAVYDVLRQRFLRLPEGGTDLLAAAAVAGSPVSVDDVAAVTGLPPDRVLELVDDAVAARLAGRRRRGAGRARPRAARRGGARRAVQRPPGAAAPGIRRPPGRPARDRPGPGLPDRSPLPGRRGRSTAARPRSPGWNGPPTTPSACRPSTSSRSWASRC